MRFSLAVAALPALVAAQEGPFDQYKAQFQSLLGPYAKYIPSIPNPGAHDPVAAAAGKAGSMKLNVLTLDNWKETLYEPVLAGSTVPTEWWVLISGGNSTCFGRCDKVETAFNETAAKFALLPGSPHMGYVNCDDQPILCNSWSASTANLWIFEMLPPPASVDIYKKRLNTTTTTSADLVDLKNADKAETFTLVESRFHPFNGQFTELGLSVPIAYGLWAFNLVPSWLFMLVISMVSRTMMSNRMGGMQDRQAGAPAGAAPRQ